MANSFLIRCRAQLLGALHPIQTRRDRRAERRESALQAQPRQVSPAVIAARLDEEPDAAIFDAWDVRLRAPRAPRPVEADRADEAIVAATAETAAGAEVQAWIAWDYLNGDEDTASAVEDADFDDLAERDADLDFDQRAMLAVIRSLRRIDDNQKAAARALAEAWIDRWRAVGGSFGIRYNNDHSFHSIVRGVPMSYTWTPTDEGNPNLAPHMWLVEEGHHTGAVKVLEALLVMVPGLHDAVWEIAAGETILARPKGSVQASATEEAVAYAASHWERTGGDGEPEDGDHFAQLVSAYFKARAAEEDERKNGALARANAEHERAFHRDEYDQHNRAHRASFEAVKAAEEHHRKHFSGPRWDAAQAVYETPAPNLAALAQKVALLDAEDEWENEDHVRHLGADIRRLAGESGGQPRSWNDALADYLSKRAASDAMQEGDPNEDAAVDAYCEAMDRLIENVPAPDTAALATKIELVRERYAAPSGGEMCVSVGIIEALLADARNLRGEA